MSLAGNYPAGPGRHDLVIARPPGQQYDRPTGAVSFMEDGDIAKVAVHVPMLSFMRPPPVGHSSRECRCFRGSGDKPWSYPPVI
jgi:hypothetical protein